MPFLTALGPAGISNFPVKSLLALPQVSEIFDDSVKVALDALPANAVIRDIPSDALVSAGLSLASWLKGEIGEHVSNVQQDEDPAEGELIKCKTCSKVHFYRGIQPINPKGN